MYVWKIVFEPFGISVHDIYIYTYMYIGTSWTPRLDAKMRGREVRYLKLNVSERPRYMENSPLTV